MPDTAAKVSRLFDGLRNNSKFALAQALQAREVAGVGATLVVQISADPAKPVEVFYSTAPSSLVAELWRSGK